MQADILTYCRTTVSGKPQAVRRSSILQQTPSVQYSKFNFWKTFSPFKNFTSLIFNRLKNILENFANS